MRTSPGMVNIVHAGTWYTCMYRHPPKVLVIRLVSIPHQILRSLPQLFTHKHFTVTIYTGMYTMAAKPKTDRRELSSVEKGMILALFYCLGTITTVAKIVGRPWSTVKNFLVRATERSSIENSPRSGRPPALTKRQKRRLVRLAKKHHKLTYLEFQACFTPNVSICTIQCVLQEVNIHK